MPTPWNISSEIQPNYDGGLMRAKWLKGGFRTVKNLAQRNAIPYLYRMMDAVETTVVFCETDSRFYKLINNPVGTTTIDSDWEAIVLGGLSTFSPVGSWDSNNLAPTLQDTDALGHDGEFYFVTNTPSPYTNTYTGLFQDNSVTVVDGNYIVSVGGYFIVVSNGTTWDSIAKPSVIDDYVAGTVIAHTHTTADITDLVTFLGDYLKHTDVADHTGSFAGVLDASIVDVGFLRTFYYTKTEVDSLLALAGVGAFITLTDTPSSYTGQALKLVRVNAGETGLEFTTGGTGGSLIKDASDTILTSRSWLKVYGGLTATDNSPNTDLTWGGALIANTTISGAFTVDYTNTLTRFKSGSLGVRNPANTFDYTFIGAAIGASRTITLPLLSGNDTLVTEAFAQSLTNKKLGSLTSNGFVKTSGGDGTLSVDTTSYLPIGGGTLTGPLILNADPTIALHAATKQYVDALLVGLWDDRGNFNASVNAYPSSGGSGSAGAILKGDIWTVSVAGTLPTGQVVEPGDTVRALIDTPGNTQSNWAIAQNNIGYTPITNVLNSGQILVGNVSNVATAVSMTGDIAITNAGVTSIGGHTVSNAKFRQSVALSIVGNSTNGTADVADIVGTNNQVLRVSGTTLGFGSIDLSQSATISTSVLGVSNGGSGTSTSFTTGSVVFAGGSGIYNQDNANFFYDSTGKTILIGTNSNSVFANDRFLGSGTVNSYLQTVVQNLSSGTAASTDIVATANTGNDTTNFIAVGINSSGNTDTSLPGALNSYIYSNGGHLQVATASAKDIIFYTNGLLAAQERFRLISGGGATFTGAGAVPTIKTIGVGTSTNYTYRSFQSDGTTEIYSLLDNGKTINTSTFTAVANNEVANKYIQTLTSRATASDTIIGNYFTNVFNVSSTTVNPGGTVFDYNAIMQGGLVTGSLFTKLSTPSTLAGMTVTTYTTISAASTSGSGTGAVFTIIVGSATTITSVTVTTAGSSYKVGETVTFNGSQFGAGTGSVVYTITSVTGQTLGNNAAVLRIINRLPSTFQGPSWKAIQFEDGDGDVIGSFQVKGGLGGRSIGLYASNSITVFSTDGATLNIPLSFTCNANSTIGGNNNYGSGIWSSFITSSFVSTGSGSTFDNTNSAYHHSANKSSSLIVNNSVFSSFTAKPTISTGVVNTLGVITGGSGYTNGTYNSVASTGGSGTGLNINITVSGGAVTAVTVSSRGSGYVVGDIISAPAASIGGTGSGFSIPVSTVDFSGVIVAGHTYAPSQSGASSANSFYGWYGKPTYNLTNQFTGKIAGVWWDPTVTSNTGTSYSFVSTHAAALGGVGGIPTSATWQITGSSSNISLKIVGAGTTTNYTTRFFQSDGTTEIFSVLDNGLASHTGDLKLLAAGNGLYIKEGSNATMGISTLVGGTVVVSTTKVTASSRIFLTGEGGNITNLGSYSVTARSAGTSFTISSTNVLDTNTVCWIILEPA